ncbi:MAG: class II aldolase/adducin family protein, partial [Acidobacteriaceae bacterium]
MEKIDRNLLLPIVRRAVLDCVAVNQSIQTLDEPAQLFHSPEANVLKEEIVRAGKKLWDRQYVDGNGGNISVRLSPQYVLCTPTLCSKADLCMEDLSLVDLDNYQICGDRLQTSEILLHLEIYKAVPAAKAVIHCHPPYATAHAIAGVVPQGNLLPEQEVFVGPVAMAPYETPGTPAFAQTVLPYVEDHNTILLKNHGIVCWADTVTHAEWYAEIVETYCKTIMIASQLRPKLTEIPPDKVADLLARKKRMGLPDARLPKDPDRNRAGSPPMHPASGSQHGSGEKHLDKHELEELI